MKTFIVAIVVLFFASCASEVDAQRGEISEINQPVYLSDSIQVIDPLNTQYFKVEVMGNMGENVCDIRATNGFLTGNGQMVMPRNSKNLQPVLYRSSRPLTFIVGFKIPGSDSVYKYFEVSAEQKNIEMNYMKAYQF